VDVEFNDIRTGCVVEGIFDLGFDLEPRKTDHVTLKLSKKKELALIQLSHHNFGRFGRPGLFCRKFKFLGREKFKPRK